MHDYLTSLKCINFECHSLHSSPTVALCPRGRNKAVNLATFLTTKVEHFFVWFLDVCFHTCLNEWLFHFICSSLSNFLIICNLIIN